MPTENPIDGKRKPREQRPQVENPPMESLIKVLPKGIPTFVRRLLVLKVLSWLVKQGFMGKGNADKLKHPEGTPRYVPRRQKIASSGHISDNDRIVLDNLVDHAFPQNGNPPRGTHYSTLIGLARDQGISQTSVDSYLIDLLDTKTARDIGLAQDRD